MVPTYLALLRKTTIALVAVLGIFASETGEAQSILDGAKIIPVPTSKPSEENAGTKAYDGKTRRDTNLSGTGIVRLNAVISAADSAISEGLVWRVYSDEPGQDGKLALVATTTDASPEIPLRSGYYIIHAAFGYAGSTKRIKVAGDTVDVRFELDAGGLRLNSAFRSGDIIPAKNLTFEIAQLEKGTLRPLVKNAKADDLIRLRAGNYRITSRYGKLNSEVSANVRINAGKLTELTLYQRAAEVSLKLVSETGGEALANTTWTILTPGGDPVVNTFTSAYPSFMLAAGDYLAYAQHDGETHSISFTLTSGRHKSLEVMLGQKDADRN